VEHSHVVPRANTVLEEPVLSKVSLVVKVRHLVLLEKQRSDQGVEKTHVHVVSSFR
jgi:hypothetical protein